MQLQPGNTSKLVAYADDFIVAGNLEEVKVLWQILGDLGPKFRYYPRASKSWWKIALREHPFCLRLAGSTLYQVYKNISQL